MINIKQKIFDHLRNEKLFLLSIISINLIIKAVPASMIELGNDEVYYWTYALFPDWSHFDHPPMVGIMIQLFTLNLTFISEFFIRLSSLILSSMSIILLFYLVKRIYSLQTAYISTFLFTASVYFNVISGWFILPDGPQMFFVILSLYFGVPAVMAVNPSKKDFYNIILFGLFVGLAFLSKYHSLFLWFGFGLYVIFYNRQWLRIPSFYLSLLITLILMIPVIYWNINHNFISFTFHSSRIGLFGCPIDLTSFMQFNLGQIFYQNPILFIIFILTIISILRKKSSTMAKTDKLLLCLSLPMILTFTLFSLFKSTFPHWSGPAFIGLIILSSNWLSEKMITNRGTVLTTLISANLLIVITLMLAPVQINSGLIYYLHKGTDPTRVGENDFTLDMYGWKQSGIKFQQFLKKEGIKEEDHKRVKIISNKWFPAAHLDFYIAHPLNIDLLVSGNVGEAHEYYWINQIRGIIPGDKIYYITSSQQFYEPDSLVWKFGKIIPKDTIGIERNGKIVKNLFIYELADPTANLNLLNISKSYAHKPMPSNMVPLRR
jgi:hypothetical protein